MNSILPEVLQLSDWQLIASIAEDVLEWSQSRNLGINMFNATRWAVLDEKVFVGEPVEIEGLEDKYYYHKTRLFDPINNRQDTELVVNHVATRGMVIEEERRVGQGEEHYSIIEVTARMDGHAYAYTSVPVSMYGWAICRAILSAVYAYNNEQ